MNSIEISDPRIELRAGKEEDISNIVELWVETIKWHAELDRDFMLDKDGRKNFEHVLTNALKDPTQVVVVASEKNKIIGFLYGYLKKYSGFFRKRVVAHISDITIREEYRRKGIGHSLMKSFENDFAKIHNSDDLSLFVHIKNEAGVDFYKNLGFEITLLTMKKSINPEE